MDSIRLVEEFHEAFNLPTDQAVSLDKLQPDEYADLISVANGLRQIAEALHTAAARHNSMPLLRAQLMVEELGEVLTEMAHVNPDLMLKELCDLQYVIDGTFLTYGLDPYKDDAFSEVHRSNMSKLGDDGKPILSPAGRVMKGPNYSPADLSEVVK